MFFKIVEFKSLDITQFIVKFWNIYRLLANYMTIIINNEYYDFKRIAYGKSDKIEIIDKELYEMFLQQVKEV